MKQYARFLKIDLEKMIKQYPIAFEMPHKPHEFSYGIGTLEIRESLGGGAKRFPSLLWILSGIALIVILYYFFKAIGIIA